MSDARVVVSRTMAADSPHELVGLVYPLYASSKRFAQEKGFDLSECSYRLTLEVVQ